MVLQEGHNMRIIAVLAMDKNRLIGNNNSLPWHIPEDLKHFRTLTEGHTVVMGKNTYYSLPEAYRPLPRRRNIVLSRHPFEAVESYTSPERLIESLQKESVEQIFIIGGVQVYTTFFQKNLIDTVELTLLDGEYTGDLYIPEFRDSFRVIRERPFSHGTFQTLIRNF